MFSYISLDQTWKVTKYSYSSSEYLRFQLLYTSSLTTFNSNILISSSSNLADYMLHQS